MAFIEGGPQANIGKDIGAGVGQWLDQLASMKMQDVYQRQQQRKQAEHLRAGGMPEWLAYVSPQMQAAYVKGMGKNQSGTPLTEAENLETGTPITGNAGFIKALGGTPTPAIPEVTQPGVTPVPPKVAMPSKTTSLAVSPWRVKPDLEGLVAPKVDQARLQQLKARMTEAQLEKYLARKDKEQEKYLKQQQVVAARLKPVIEDIETRGSTEVQEVRAQLDELDALIDSGKLTPPTEYSRGKMMAEEGGKILGGLGGAIGGIAGGALGTVGGPVGTVAGAGSGGALGSAAGYAAGKYLYPVYTGNEADQLYDKLSTNAFSKMAKVLFGSKMTQNEYEQFMNKAVLSHMQNDPVKKTMNAGFKSAIDIALNKKKVADEILEETGGIYPRNFEALLKERTRKYNEASRQDEVDKVKKLLKI